MLLTAETFHSEIGPQIATSWDLLSAWNSHSSSADLSSDPLLKARRPLPARVQEHNTMQNKPRMLHVPLAASKLTEKLLGTFERLPLFIRSWALQLHYTHYTFRSQFDGF